MFNTKKNFNKEGGVSINDAESIRKGSSIEQPITDWFDFLEKSKADFNLRMATRREPSTLSSNDFYFIKTLGIGAYGRVMLVQSKLTEHFYAVKLIKKHHIVKLKQIKHAFNERNVLSSIRFPFTVNLEHFFHDNVYLYFVMPLVEGGEMFMHLRNQGKFDEQLSRFYAAQVLLALEYLHYLGLIYRDIKPENILIDKQGYIRMTDFGFCKLVKDRTYTLCGTPEYIAPEILLSKGYGKSADFWSFGILLYELNSGLTPFFARDQLKIFEKIVEGNYRNQPHFSNDLRNIIRHLLEADLSRRFGILKHGVDDIKNHRWFKKVLWVALANKTIKAPYIPYIQGPGDSVYFEKVEEEPLERRSNDPYESAFADF